MFANFNFIDVFLLQGVGSSHDEGLLSVMLQEQEREESHIHKPNGLLGVLL